MATTSLSFNTDRGSRNAAMRTMADAIIQAGGSVAGINKTAGETHPNWQSFLDALIVGANALAGGTQLPRYTSIDYNSWQSVMNAIAAKVGVLGTIPQNVTIPMIINQDDDLGAVTQRVSSRAELGDTLICHPGEWAGADSITYSWWRDTVVIAGATAQRYTVVEADQGSTIVCRVTATNEIGSAFEDTDFYDVPAVLPPTPDVFTFFNLDNPPFAFHKPNRIGVPLTFNKGTRNYGYVQSRVYCRDHDGNNVTIPDASLSWRTTNSAIATSTDEDSPNAIIELRGVGVATVTCRNDTFKSEWGCEFTVVADPPPVVVGGPATTAVILIDPVDDQHSVLGQRLQVAVSFGDGGGNMVPAPGDTVWTSSDETVAVITPTINPAGAHIDLIKVGEVTITATAGGISDTLEVHVVDETDLPGAPTRCTMVSEIPDAPEEVVIGLNADIGVRMLTYDAADIGIPGSPYTFVSADPAILTIAPSGPSEAFVTGVAVGTATVTATLDSDNTITDTITIQVIDLTAMAPPDTTSATSILLKLPDNSPNTFVAGGAPVTVTAEYRRGDAAAPPPSSDFSWMLEDKVGNSIVFTFGSGTQTSVVLTPVAGGRQTLVHRCPRDGSGLIAEIQVICTDAPGLEQQPGTPPAEAAPKSKA